MAQQQHDFSKMAEIAKSEINRDAPKMKDGLDLTADASNVSANEMVHIVRANWNDPTFRHDLVDREAPDRVTELLLKAGDVRNQDGTPMTVHQYKTNVLQPFLDTGTSPYLPPPAPPQPSPTLNPNTPPLGVPAEQTAPMMNPDGSVNPTAPSAPASAPTTTPIQTAPEALTP